MHHGRGRPRRRRACVDRPQSRLSKRMTNRPPSASSLQKLVVPRGHLRGEAHHEQQRRVVGRAERVVLELDAGAGTRSARAWAETTVPGMTVFGVHAGLQHTTTDELRSRVARDRGPRLRLDLGLGPLLRRHRQARRRRVPRGGRDARRARVHHDRRSAAARSCTRSATAIRPCWPRRSPRSTSSPAAAPTWASAPAGPSSSTTRTASRSRDVKTRMDQLEEGIQVPPRPAPRRRHRRSRASGSPLNEARNEPRPVQAKLPIWIGGGGEKRTLQIAAQYADGWNVPFVAPEAFAHKSAVLDRALRRRRPRPGRDPRAINVGLAWTEESLARAVRRARPSWCAAGRAVRQRRADRRPHRRVRRGRRRPGRTSRCGRRSTSTRSERFSRCAARLT